MTGPNYDTVPGDNGRDLKRYIEEGVPLGGFLDAVLSNDLADACARADQQNRYIIWDYVNWLANNAPRDCWGTRNNVIEWLDVGGLEGIAEEQSHS